MLTTNTTTEQLAHYLLTMSLRTSVEYTPTLLSDTQFLKTVSAARISLLNLSMELTEAKDFVTFLPLGPVLDGAYVSGSRKSSTWIRLKVEILLTSTHSTPEQVMAFLEKRVGRRWHWERRSPRPHRHLPITGHVLYARRLDSLGSPEARAAIERVEATERMLNGFAAAKGLLAPILPTKREIGLADMILPRITPKRHD